MFNYFLHSIVLIFLGYASLYPILFWVTPSNKIEISFYRFNLGKCCIVGFLGALAYHFISTDTFTETIIWIWILVLMLATGFYWKKNKGEAAAGRPVATWMIFSRFHCIGRVMGPIKNNMPDPGSPSLLVLFR